MMKLAWKQSTRRAPTIMVGLVLLVSCAKKPEPVIDQAIFELTYRAAKAVEGSTSVGVDYQKFGELLQVFSTELSIAKDKSKTPNDQKMVGLFGDVLIAYNDSFRIWKAKIENAQYSFLKGGSPSKGLEDVVQKYGLTLTTLSDFNRTQILPEDAMQSAWMAADQKLAEAIKYYYSVE